LRCPAWSSTTTHSASQRHSSQLGCSLEDLALRLDNAQRRGVGDRVEGAVETESLEIALQPARRIREQHDRHHAADVVQQFKHFVVEHAAELAPGSNCLAGSIAVFGDERLGGFLPPLLIRDEPRGRLPKKLRFKGRVSDGPCRKSELPLDVIGVTSRPQADHTIEVAQDSANHGFSPLVLH
jgi:hypothetical protein